MDPFTIHRPAGVAKVVFDSPHSGRFYPDDFRSNATRLDPSDAATLASIGCVSCPYPAADPDVFPANPSIAIWVLAR